MSRLASLGYQAGWSAIQFLPKTPTWLGFRNAADLATMRGGKGVERLRSNLARVTGRNSWELERLTRDAMRSYARYWYDVFKLPALSGRDIDAGFVVDIEQIRAVSAQGRGIILVLGHLANWDMAGAWLVRQGYPFTTVAERLEPAELFDQFVEFRQSLGMEVLALTGGETPPFEILAQRLREQKVLCLLADRDLSQHGVPVEFFGSTATMPAGPAKLALETGAALIPTTLWYGPKWLLHGRLDPEIEHTDVATMTQQVADCFARTISEHPADWHMLQRLWRDDLGPRKPPLARATRWWGRR